jgi:hypothetical protein
MDDVQNRFCIIDWRENCGSGDDQCAMRNKEFKQQWLRYRVFGNQSRFPSFIIFMLKLMTLK